jgi:hypothetical protein
MPIRERDEPNVVGGVGPAVSRARRARLVSDLRPGRQLALDALRPRRHAAEEVLEQRVARGREPGLAAGDRRQQRHDRRRGGRIVGRAGRELELRVAHRDSGDAKGVQAGGDDRRPTHEREQRVAGRRVAVDDHRLQPGAHALRDGRGRRSGRDLSRVGWCRHDGARQLDLLVVDFAQHLEGDRQRVHAPHRKSVVVVPSQRAARRQIERGEPDDPSRGRGDLLQLCRGLRGEREEHHRQPRRHGRTLPDRRPRGAAVMLEDQVRASWSAPKPRRPLRRNQQIAERGL